MYLLKKSFRNNDLSLCSEAFRINEALRPDYAESQTEPSTTDDMPSPLPGERR
ncbi:Bgt- [Pseudomonas sp. IT-P294]